MAASEPRTRDPVRALKNVKNRGCCYLEAKSVTLVDGGCALFPDAPTERGRRYVEELARRARRRAHAAVVFVIQREDAEAFSPNVPPEPELARALR